jgi:rare lipoprotein A
MPNSVAHSGNSNDSNQQIKVVTQNITTAAKKTLVSWYKCCSITASGERYNPHGLSVAHKKLPFGTKVKFTNPHNGKSVVLRVNDRGPYIKGRDYDVSMGAAKELGFIDRGVANLYVEIIK